MKPQLFMDPDTGILAFPGLLGRGLIEARLRGR